MEFKKKFVRVEWMAFQRAVNLMREAGLNATYFVSESNLLGDEGQAPLLAEVGRELYNKGGELVKTEPLNAEDLGLSDDIEELAQRSDDSPYDGNYFLKRTYDFFVYEKGKKISNMIIHVSLAKQTQDDDWELVLESLVDSGRSGDDRWIIYRHNLPK